MSRAAIRVEPEMLLEVVKLLKACGIKIAGSMRVPDGEIGLYIEGDPVPDGGFVRCIIERIITDKSATLKLTFEPVHNASETS